MKFKFTGSGKVDLISTDKSTDDRRWELLSSIEMKNLYPKTNWGWINEIMERENEITNIVLGNDKFNNRPVIAKTVNYRFNDVQDAKSINARRKALIDQIDILNDLKSSLLPEILDWFTIKNTLDPFYDENCRYNEPVLILDYIPGISLKWTIEAGKFKREVKGQPKEDDSETNKYVKGVKREIFEEEYEDLGAMVNIPKIGKVALKTMYFLKSLTQKGYAHMALNPDHILMLKDDVPRFVGVGRITRTINGLIDHEHMNSQRTVPGYSAPELNDYITPGRRENARVEAVAAFSLGVLIHQMVVGRTDFDKEMLKGPAFIYPNPISEPLISGKKSDGVFIHNLLTKLCNHDENQRLTDFDEIEKELQKLASMYISGLEGRIKTHRNIEGTVSKYFYHGGFGSITCENGKSYSFNQTSIKNMNEENRSKLAVGATIKFDGTEKPNKEGEMRYFADNLVVIKPVQRTYSDSSKSKSERPNFGNGKGRSEKSKLTYNKNNNMKTNESARKDDLSTINNNKQVEKQNPKTSDKKDLNQKKSKEEYSSIISRLREILTKGV